MENTTKIALCAKLANLLSKESCSSLKPFEELTKEEKISYFESNFPTVENNGVEKTFIRFRDFKKFVKDENGNEVENIAYFANAIAFASKNLVFSENAELITAITNDIKSGKMKETYSVKFKKVVTFEEMNQNELIDFYTEKYSAPKKVKVRHLCGKNLKELLLEFGFNFAEFEKVSK